jgi:hypothetical protein
MLGSGCRDVLGSVMTTSSGQTVSHAEQLFAALAARVSDPWRDARYDVARIKIANAAFIPSRIWGDTGVWVATTGSRRTLLVTGRLAGARYRLEAVRALLPIVQPGDSRHVINLSQLASDEFSWDTDVAYAVGGLSAAEGARLISTVLTSAEGRSEKDIRADYAATVPRAAAALGQLFHVDSVKTVTLADRSTVATYVVTMRPAGVEQMFPNFAKYLRRYAESADMRWTVSDRAGASFVETSMSHGVIRLRVRSLGGALAPISPAGPARAMPDSLVLSGDMTLKVRHFTVGFSGFHAELTHVRTPRERSWNLVSREEPHWVLPLVTERLLKTPLRRPFQGSGALFRIGIRDDSTGAPSVLHRRMHLEVQESLILRFIGRLGATAISDYSGEAEREQYAFLSEVFNALVVDARALRGSVSLTGTGSRAP